MQWRAPGNGLLPLLPCAQKFIEFEGGQTSPNPTGFTFTRLVPKLPSCSGTANSKKEKEKKKKQKKKLFSFFFGFPRLAEPRDAACHSLVVSQPTSRLRAVY